MAKSAVFEVSNPLGTLQSLQAERFTAFENQTFEFSPGLNIIVGENGSGKTHLLKLAYAATKALFPLKSGRAIGKLELITALTGKLLRVFLPDDLRRLRRITGAGRPNSARITLRYAGYDTDTTSNTLAFEIGTSSDKIKLTEFPAKLPSEVIGGPVYLPPREVVSLVPSFGSDYARFSTRFEETYADLVELLTATPLRGPRPAGMSALLAPLETAMAGKLVADENGRLYLKFNDGKRIEATLVSEGYRKLATLAYLIQNGSLAQHGSVFWDEPEANLNPRLMGALSETLVKLAGNGVQLFIATHSLFFLREFCLRLDRLKIQKKSIPMRFFSLTNDDGAARVDAADDIDGLGIIASLDAALTQENELERLHWEMSE